MSFWFNIRFNLTSRKCQFWQHWKNSRLHKIYSIPIIDKEIWAWQEQTKPCITRRWLPYRHHDYVPVKRLDHKLFNIASTYVYIISKTSYIKFGNLGQVPQDIYPNLAQESLITGPVLLWKTSSVFPCYLVSSLLLST